MRDRYVKKGVFPVCIFTILTAGLFKPSVHGAYYVKYCGGDSVFYVIGETAIKKQGMPITLRVSDGEDILYIKQTDTDIEGKYSFCFDLQQYGGAEIYVSEEGDIGEGDTDIYKSTEQEVKRAITRLNSGENKETVLREEWQVLQVKTEEIDTLKTDSMFLETLSKKQYSTLEDFTETYSEGKFLVLLHRSKSPEEAKKLSEEILDSEILSQMNVGKTFLTYDDTKRLLVFKKLYGKSYAGLEAFYSALYDAVIMEEISSVRNYGEKFNVIKENNDFIKLDLNLLDSLGLKAEELKIDLMKSNLQNVEDIKTQYEALYKKYVAEKTVDKNSGGSKGSGGGGSSVGDVFVSENVLPQQQYPQSAYFSDLSGFEWAREAIETLAVKGIVAGREQNLFVPQETVTRAELAKLVVNACKLDTIVSDNGSRPFEDVSADFWGYEYIMTAGKLGVVEGINETLFSPDGSVTRQDMATICHRVLAICDVHPEEKREADYADADTIAAYAREAVLKLSRIGLLNGTDNQCFEPNRTATRAEAAKVIYETWKLIEGKG